VGEDVTETAATARFPLLDRLSQRINGAISGADSLLARPAAWWTAVALVVVLQIALIVSHQPWPDEYQALQLAVMSPDIATMVDWLSYEGHPPLWYLILRGLSYMMDPHDTLWIAALLCAIPTLWVILFASPFSRTERLMIATSEFVLFESLTVSRSMSLGVAVMFIAFALWRKRSLWLMIAILPFCDFLFGVISGILVLLKWQEKQLWWPGVGLWLVFSAIAGWTVIPAPDMVSAFDYFSMDKDVTLWFTKMSGLLVPFQGGILPGWNKPTYPLAGMLWIGFLLLAWFTTRGRPFQQLLLFGFIGFTFVFSFTVYPIGLRHLMLIALVLILLVWLHRLAGDRPSGAFRAWLAVIALSGLGTAAMNFVKPFDTAHQAIAEIEQRGLADKHWMVFPDWRVPGLTAQSDILFERPEQECMLSFVRWDYQTSLLDGDNLTAYLRQAIEERGKFYLASDLPIEVVPEDVLQPIFETEEGYDGLTYYLYLVGPDAPEKPVELPACVPDQRPLVHF
jgi:hypothetical protein